MNMADENPPRSAPDEGKEPPIEPSPVTDTMYSAPSYRRSKRRRNLLILVVVLVVVVGGVFLWRYLSSYESTDDAQADVHLYPVSARISGYVIKVNVDDNQWVQQGTVLVEIDPKDYEVAVAQAKANLASAEATAQSLNITVPITSISTVSQLTSTSSDIENATAGVSAAEKQLLAAHAQLEQAQANDIRAQEDLRRYKLLVDKREVAQQIYDQALATARSSTAAVAAAAANESAAQQYVQDSYRFEEKLFAALKSLPAPQSVVEMTQRTCLDYFQSLLIKQMDLVERRLLKEEKIPHREKIFSLFEPHTEFIKKGKLFPPVELGHKLLLTTDEHELILDYRVMDQQPNEVEEVVGVADRLLGRYGAESIQSLSFDKGFSREEDRQLLELYIPQVVMPKRGKRNLAEREREGQRSFRALRHRHHAVESDINCLEHHGLDRCPDKGLAGYKRYAGLGVLAYNLHKVGKRLLEKRRVGAMMRCLAV